LTDLKRSTLVVASLVTDKVPLLCLHCGVAARWVCCWCCCPCTGLLPTVGPRATGVGAAHPWSSCAWIVTI